MGGGGPMSDMGGPMGGPLGMRGMMMPPAPPPPTGNSPMPMHQMDGLNMQDTI
jgi:hypothetical protein